MKKVLLGVAALSFLASCGGGGKSDADILKDAQAKFDAEKTELEKKADDDCNAKIEAKSNEWLDTLKARAAAEKKAPTKKK